MKFNYEFEKASGVKVCYWVIGKIEANVLTRQASVQGFGYASEEAYLEGKPCDLEHWQHFSFEAEEANINGFVQALADLFETSLKAME